MYGYDNYKKVKDAIEARRLAAISEAEGRNDEVRAVSAEIREIDRELTGTGLLVFRAACRGEDITPIKERNQELMRRRKAALLALGYPEDYTEVKYSCPACSDSGFLAESGRMCACFREELLRENIKSSGIGRLIEKQSFDNFSLEYYKDNEDVLRRMERNLKIARDFAENFGEREENLLLIGKTGTGKTHLSTAIARKVIERGYEVLYDSTQNIVAAFEADKFRSGYGSYENQGDKYLECDLLILDDLGTEMVTQFTVSCLYNLLNTRMNKGLKTVISTNLSPAELQNKYEDRIYSRIVGSGSKILLFGGEDRRLSN